MNNFLLILINYFIYIINIDIKISNNKINNSGAVKIANSIEYKDLPIILLNIL